MVSSYMRWSQSRGDTGLASLDIEDEPSEVADEYKLTVVDIFCKFLAIHLAISLTRTQGRNPLF
jgi:hypothetical protein